MAEDGRVDVDPGCFGGLCSAILILTVLVIVLANLGGA